MSQSGDFDLAMQLAQAGQFEEAISLCRMITLYDASHAPAWHLLGVSLLKQGKVNEATAPICKALELQPCTALYRSNLGAAELQRGNLAAAVSLFRDSVVLRPNVQDYRLHLIGALCRAGELSEALSLIENELPTPNILLRKAEIYLALDRIPEAKQIYTNANAASSVPEALHGLGLVHLVERKFDDAVDCLRKAVRASKKANGFQQTLANALERAGEHEAAGQELTALISADPSNLLLRIRSAAQIPAVYDCQEAIDLEHNLLRERLAECRNFPAQLDLAQAHVSGCCPPFHLTHLGTDNRTVKEEIASVFRPHIAQPVLNPLATGRPRVGFVVTRDHEGIFLRGMAAFFRGLNRDIVERRIFCEGSRAALIARETNSLPTECVSLQGNLLSMIDSIVESRCDVLYYWEVGTDSTNYFLAQHRLAPRQCTSFGVQETSGLSSIDDYLSSQLLDGESDQAKFTEHLVRLSTIPAFIEAPKTTVDPNIRSRLGIPGDRNLYLCNQNPLKLHPHFDQALKEILQQDDRATVVLTGGLASGIRRRLQFRQERVLGAAAQRIIWTPWLNESDFNSLTAVADIVLDTFPMGAGTSAFTTLGLGAPMVTMRGESNRGRMTAACLEQLSIRESICDSLESYTARAIEVATNPELRRHIRTQLVECAPLLFDHHRSIADLQSYFAN